MTKAQSGQGFVRNLTLSVFVPMLLLSTLTFGFYIISGLKDAYDTKLQQVDDLSALLSISSSSAKGSAIASGQIAQTAYQDRIIESAKFYPFDRIENLTNPKSLNLIALLSQDRVSVQEPVTSDVAAHIATGQNNNRTLMGYINITIDLNQLRMDWFERHFYRLLGIGVSYLLLTWMIFDRMKRPIKQFEQLVDGTVDVTQGDMDSIHALLNKQFTYSELSQIQSLIYALNSRYKAEHQSYQELKRHSRQGHVSQKSSLNESSFQSMITHELKTSLEVILTSLQLLDNFYMSDEQKTVVDNIGKGSMKLESILSQIIQLNRIEKGQMSVQVEAFQPIQLINELVDKYQQFAESRGIKIYSTINHIDCILQGDEPKIRSILESLISNAFKYTEQGSIRVESNLIYFENSIRWWINVIDTGIGIEGRYLKDIFLSFVNSNPKPSNEFNDTAISLGLANKLANLLNGQILIESEPNEGSKLSLVLPLPDNQHALERNLLSGVKVICFTSRDIYEAMRAFEKYDAEAIKLNDKQQVLDYIKHNHVNLLVIASDIEYDQAIYLTQQVRANEVSSRLIIAYYDDNFTQANINELQASGVDMCRPIPTDFDAEANVITNWLGIVKV